MRVTTRELVTNWGTLAETAMREPIMVTQDGSDRLVVISAEEYARLRRSDRQVLRAEELTDREAELIARSEVPDEYEHLNGLLDNKAP